MFVIHRHSIYCVLGGIQSAVRSRESEFPPTRELNDLGIQEDQKKMLHFRRIIFFRGRTLVPKMAWNPDDTWG